MVFPFFCICRPPTWDILFSLCPSEDLHLRVQHPAQQSLQQGNGLDQTLYKNAPFTAGLQYPLSPLTVYMY